MTITIGDTITQWAFIGSMAAITAGVIIWHYGKRAHQRWLASIHPWHSTRSYGHVRTIRPPYDWERQAYEEKELHG